MKKFVCMLVMMVMAGGAMAERIRDLVNIAGVRPNQLTGYGLVVGLDGTGDSNTASPFTGQSLSNMLSELGIQVPTGTTLNQKNSAAVIVTATMLPFARPGQSMDVTVSSMGDAKSLRGGTLVMAPLKGADGQIYAMAQGNVVIGQSGASTGAARGPANQLSSGRIPDGATVERAVPSPLGNGDYVNLELIDADFTTAERVVQAVNAAFGADTAHAQDSRVIQVRAPFGNNDRVQFLAKMENLAVEPAEVAPLVIINARTGSIVINQGVRLEPCAVSHGNLSVTIGPAASATVAATPATPAAPTKTNTVFNVPKGANLNQIVNALNALGASPQDLISILQAMKAAGSLQAELQVI
jgi:flagellar P-ring protein precursor FlgI